MTGEAWFLWSSLFALLVPWTAYVVWTAIFFDNRK